MKKRRRRKKKKKYHWYFDNKTRCITPLSPLRQPKVTQEKFQLDSKTRFLSFNTFCFLGKFLFNSFVFSTEILTRTLRGSRGLTAVTGDTGTYWLLYWRTKRNRKTLFSSLRAPNKVSDARGLVAAFDSQSYVLSTSLRLPLCSVLAGTNAFSLSPPKSKISCVDPRFRFTKLDIPTAWLLKEELARGRPTRTGRLSWSQSIYVQTEGGTSLGQIPQIRSLRSTVFCGCVIEVCSYRTSYYYSIGFYLLNKCVYK